jgi:protein-S-isoprenylcysteine O-methyltransferase Ste14
VQPPLFLLVAMGLIVITHVVAPLHRYLAYPLTLVGLAPLALGVYLNLAADTLFKRGGTPVKVGEDSTTLVTTGVFRLTRNPMYLGFALLLLGIALLLGTAGPLWVVVVFPAVIQRTFIRVEEAALEDRFGEAWRAYRGRVRRWV